MAAISEMGVPPGGEPQHDGMYRCAAMVTITSAAVNGGRQAVGDQARDLSRCEIAEVDSQHDQRSILMGRLPCRAAVAGHPGRDALLIDFEHAHPGHQRGGT